MYLQVVVFLVLLCILPPLIFSSGGLPRTEYWQMASSVTMQQHCCLLCSGQDPYKGTFFTILSVNVYPVSKFCSLVRHSVQAFHCGRRRVFKNRDTFSHKQLWNSEAFCFQYSVLTVSWCIQMWVAGATKWSTTFLSCCNNACGRVMKTAIWRIQRKERPRRHLEGAEKVCATLCHLTMDL